MRIKIKSDISLFFLCFSAFYSTAATINVGEAGSYNKEMAPSIVEGNVMTNQVVLTASSTTIWTNCLSSSTPEFNLQGRRIPMTASHPIGWVLTPNIEITGFQVVGIYPNLINSCLYAVRVTAQLHIGNQVFSETVTVPAAIDCQVTLPDHVDLGSFTTKQIQNGVTSSSKIDISAACSSPYSLTFSGTGSGEGDFLLGDTTMRLSYNNGVNHIVNGQPFTPANTQMVDIDLFSTSSSGTAPAAGVKTTALTVTLNLL